MTFCCIGTYINEFCTEDPYMYAQILCGSFVESRRVLLQLIAAGSTAVSRGLGRLDIVRV